MTLLPAWRRTAQGLGVGLAMVALIAVALVPVRERVDAATPTATMVLAVCVAAAVGGIVAAVLTALAAGLVVNLAFIVPYGTLKVRAVEDGIGLASFVAVALIVGALVAVIDSARRAGEAQRLELNRRNRELEGVLAERERLLADARLARSLEQLDAERTALLRSVSHDLRTPLSVIRAIADDLRHDVYDTATRNELLTSVVHESDRLDRMVANLLDMSRIEAGQLEPRRAAADLDDLVHRRLLALGSLLQHVRVEVRIADDVPLVDVDEVMIEQVLTNLIANAVRHSPADADLWIVAALAGRWVRVEVSDRGPGISESDQRRVFLPFQRGEGSRSSGVGLAICKAIVEAHGGSIWFEPRFGGGTTFVFTLPLFVSEGGR